MSYNAMLVAFLPLLIIWEDLSGLMRSAPQWGYQEKSWKWPKTEKTHLPCANTELLGRHKHHLYHHHPPHHHHLIIIDQSSCLSTSGVFRIKATGAEPLMFPLSPFLTTSWLNCSAQTALFALVMAGLKLSGLIPLIMGVLDICWNPKRIRHG